MRRDRSPARELATTEVRGHLTFTPEQVTAWYTVPERVWAFRPDPEREALLAAVAEQYAGLAGLRLHLRRTTRPFPVREWVATALGNAAPLPDVPGARRWAQHLHDATLHVARANHTEGHTMLGVTFARRHVGDLAADWARRTLRRPGRSSEVQRLVDRVAQFDDLLAGYGLSARPATPAELAWLLYRSIGLGLRVTHPPATDVEPADILALTEHVDRFRTRYGSTTRVVDRQTGEAAHVAVLTVGRMEELDIPQVHEPWLHLAAQMPWPVELSSRVDILGPAASRGSLGRRLLMLRAQQVEYAEHGLDAPPHLERLAGRALRVGDQIDTGRPVDASRAHGWHRLAVTGPTVEDCLQRAGILRRLYTQQLRVDLRHPKDQYRLAGEFIPGEPVADTGYLRRMPVRLLAAALPQAAATVGDRRGDLIGHTAGTGRRPVFFDPHFPTEVRERSGLTVLVSEPGGGKSTLLGAVGYLAARRGVQVTLLDPSGPLARLCDLPELAGHARVLDLAGSRAGTLNPYALVPTPRRGDYPDGPDATHDHAQAVADARAERRAFVLDVAAMLLPVQVMRRDDIITALRDAIREVPAGEDTTLDDLIDQLDTAGQHGDTAAKQVANLLRDARQLPLARLFFGTPPDGVLDDTTPLTVITLAGLRLPDMTIDREHWSTEEALALPMLHTAHRLAVRRCYRGDMGRRKLVALDEAHFLQGWPSGRSFLVRLARDSRKWNLAALVASQNPADILGLDVQNLVSTVFVGRIADDTEIAAEALRLLRIPTGAGYEQTLAALSQIDTTTQDRLGFREFVMRDVDGRVQTIRVDVSWVPGLLDRLDTTPAATLTTSSQAGGR
jgi:hypothetical protein